MNVQFPPVMGGAGGSSGKGIALILGGLSGLSNCLTIGSTSSLGGSTANLCSFLLEIFSPFARNLWISPMTALRVIPSFLAISPEVYPFSQSSEIFSFRSFFILAVPVATSKLLSSFS